MKNILVPTDFSTEAAYALKVAVALAQPTKAKICLMHVIQSLYESAYAASADLPDEGWKRLEDRIEKAEEQLQEVIKEQQVQSADITPYVKVGSVFEEVPPIIARSDADLIILGTKGDSGWHELLVGSQAEKVVRYAHCPVLTVPRSIENFGLRDVVLATTFDDREKPLLDLLSQWQPVFGFTLHLVYVNTPLNYTSTAKIEARRAKFLDRHILSDYTTAIVDDYSEREGLQYYSTKIKADLVAMLTHGRDGLAHFLDGSITEDAVNHLPIPVLTYNIHANE